MCNELSDQEKFLVVRRNATLVQKGSGLANTGGEDAATIWNTSLLWRYYVYARYPEKRRAWGTWTLIEGQDSSRTDKIAMHKFC